MTGYARPGVPAVPPVPAPHVADLDLRPFMARFPTGVTVVTTRDGGTPYGMTCSSLSSVSLSPPVVLVCLRGESPTLRAAVGSGAFSVNLLHDRGRATAALFASGAPDRFERVTWTQPDTLGGPHLVDDAHAVADCRLVDTKSVGDHVVLFGGVRAVTVLDDAAPLLYGMRRYATWPAG